MAIDPDIINSVKSGECILFLGAMASAALPPQGSRFVYKDAPPSGSELSRLLAKEFGYNGDEADNLARVSLYVEYREENRPQGPRRVGSRDALVQALKRYIDRDTIVPSPALHMLAALPFRIVITTNYDSLFERALSRATTINGVQKHPIVKTYDPTRMGPELVPLDPRENEPVLLKLHGDFSRNESIVITEEDYIAFIQRMSTRDQHPIHEFIRARMKTWRVLFVGYSLKDYNLRLLFRTLRWNVDVANFPLSFSVDPYPDNLIVSVWQRGEKPIVSFIPDDLWEFVPDLYKECLGKDYQ